MGMTNFLTQPNADGLVKFSGTHRPLLPATQGIRSMWNSQTSEF
jgi:hypothetical protein